MNQVYSIEKYFITSSDSIQTKEDNLYQEVLEYIRGINSNKESMVEGSISRMLLEEESKYSRINTYRFGAITWNLAGKNVSADIGIEDVLISSNNKLNTPADIYFASYQETRKLNAFAVLQGASKAKVGKFTF